MCVCFRIPAKAMVYSEEDRHAVEDRRRLPSMSAVPFLSTAARWYDRRYSASCIIPPEWTVDLDAEKNANQEYQDGPHDPCDVGDDNVGRAVRETEGRHQAVS